MSGKKVAEEKVPYYLFKDNDKYKDDVTVALNGKTYTIQRGKTVYIPLGVAEILEAQKLQDAAAADFMEKRAAEYADTLK
jgi:glyoxylate utilization-related uncharacterized protein